MPVLTRTFVLTVAFVLVLVSCSGSTADKNRTTDPDAARKVTGSGLRADAKTGVSAGDRSVGTVGGENGSSKAPGGPISEGGGSVGPISTAPIRVAFILSDTSGVAAYTGGTYGGDTDSQKREAKALADWANLQGGVNGRKVIPSYYALPITASDDELLAACTRITEDDKNQVVIDTDIFQFEKDNFCFARHKVNFIGQATSSDRRTLDSVAPYVSTTSTSLDRQMKELAPALKNAGYLTNAKLGIFADDTPAVHRNITNVLVPALTSMGAKPIAIRYASVYDGSGQTQSQAAAQTSSAVLAFKNAKIDRVISYNYGLNFLGFSKGAQSQSYYPRYAFPEFLGAPAVAVTFGDESQLKDAMAVAAQGGGPGAGAWIKEDNRDTQPTRANVRPGLRRCNDILGQQLKTNYYDGANSGASGFGPTFCEHFLLFLDAARKLGTSWSPATLGSGLKRMGTYAPARVYANDFSTGHMDGASAYTAGEFDSACVCFVRSVPWTKAPG